MLFRSALHAPRTARVAFKVGARRAAADNGEGEDPAKMKDSRTEFLDRDGPKRWPQELRDDPEPGWRLRDGTPPGSSVLLMVSRDCTALGALLAGRLRCIASIQRNTARFLYSRLCSTDHCDRPSEPSDAMARAMACISLAPNKCIRNSLMCEKPHKGELR